MLIELANGSNSIGIDHISYGGDVSAPSGVTWTYSSAISDDEAYFSDGTNFNNDNSNLWTASTSHTEGAVNTSQTILPSLLNCPSGKLPLPRD